MSKLYLTNTLSKKKEEFQPLQEGKVSFYHCGPTVYWTQHIGNLRGMTCGDLVARTLRYLGYELTHVRNYTDVGHLTSDNDEGEDKMEKGAKREGKTPKEVADKYIRIFEEDTAALNLTEPDHKPRATEHIQDMIDMVQTLLDKGYAYTTDLAVYFDVSKFKDYGRLSGQSLEDKMAGAGAGEICDSQKRNPLDFSLWFFRAGVHKNALQYWPSPFESSLVDNGEGFPGWHIECSAMSQRFLGNTMDIHMGGIEHIPVHHTNEIAQSEAANGAKFVNYWLHNEHLLAGEEKIAKSAGSTLSVGFVKDQGYNPLALRYFFLQAHYRSKQNFTWQALDAAQKGLNHLYNQVRDLGEKTGRIDPNYQEKFSEKLADDLNTPEALAVVQDMLKSSLAPEDKLATILDFDKVLGLKLREKAFSDIALEDLPPDLQEKIKQREEARENKNWEQADKLREELAQQGYILEDGQEGTRIFKK